MIPLLVPRRTHVKINPDALGVLRKIGSSQISITGIVHDTSHFFFPRMREFESVDVEDSKPASTLSPDLAAPPARRGVYLRVVREVDRVSLFLVTEGLSEKRPFDIPFFRVLYFLSEGIVYFAKYRTGEQEVQFDQMLKPLSNIAPRLRQFWMILHSPALVKGDLRKLAGDYVQNALFPFFDADPAKLELVAIRKAILARVLCGQENFRCEVIDPFTKKATIASLMEVSKTRNLFQIQDSTLLCGNDLVFYLTKYVESINDLAPMPGAAALELSPSVRSIVKMSMRPRCSSTPQPPSFDLTRPRAKSTRTPVHIRARKRVPAATDLDDLLPPPIESVDVEVEFELPDVILSRDKMDEMFAHFYWDGLKASVKSSFEERLSGILLPMTKKNLEQKRDGVMEGLFKVLEPRFGDVSGFRGPILKKRMREELMDVFKASFQKVLDRNKKVANERCRRLLLQNDSRFIRSLKLYDSIGEFDRDVRRAKLEFLAEPNLGQGRMDYLNQFLRVQQIRRTLLTFNLKNRPKKPADAQVAQRSSPLQGVRLAAKLETCFLVFTAAATLHTHRFRVHAERAYLFDFVQDYYQSGYCVSTLCYYQNHYYVNVMQDPRHEFHERMIMCKDDQLRKSLDVLRKRYGYENLTAAVFDDDLWVLVIRNDKLDTREILIDPSLPNLLKRIAEKCVKNHHGVEHVSLSPGENIAVLKRRPSKQYHLFTGTLPEIDRLVEDNIVRRKFAMTVLVKLPEEEEPVEEESKEAEEAVEEEEEGEVAKKVAARPIKKKLRYQRDRYLFCCKEKTTLLSPIYRKVRSSAFVTKAVESMVVDVLQRGYVVKSVST